MMTVADILAAFLAFGLLHLRGVQGQSGWRWLFLIEYDILLYIMYVFSRLTWTRGIITLVVGLSAFVLMPAGPCQTAHWTRGKAGWFSAR